MRNWAAEVMELVLVHTCNLKIVVCAERVVVLLSSTGNGVK